MNTKKEALKNKFSNVEDIQLNNEIRIVLNSKEKTKKPSIQKKKTGISLVLTFFKYLFLRAGIFFNLLIRGFLKFHALSVKKMNEKWQGTEVLMENYVRDSEEVIKNFEETQLLQKSRKNSGEENYITQLQDLLEVKNCSVSLGPELLKDEMSFYVKREFEALSFISQKFKERKLNSNIFSVKLNSNISQEKIITNVEFELKTNGLKWSLFVGKFVLSELSETLKNYHGSVNAEYSNNVSLGQEKYLFYFESPLELTLVDSSKKGARIRSSLTELENK